MDSPSTPRSATTGATAQAETRENFAGVEPTTTHVHELIGSPLAHVEPEDTSDAGSASLQQSFVSEDAYTSKPATSDPPTELSLSPRQLDARIKALHLPTSPSSLSGRSASRGREGYGFRPASGGANTPIGIEGINVQPGTAAVVDKNGLGWPGTYISICLWQCISIH